MDAPELPPAETRAFELDVDSVEFDLARARLVDDGLAPAGDDHLLRYLVYLGAAYLEAESLIGAAGFRADAYERLHRRYGAVGGEAAVLRFHYSEEARVYAAEQRGAAAHDSSAGAYEALVERMQDEIAVREERIRNLKKVLEP
jgi:hypothetical protein